jgi:hypothetical protein
MQLLHRLLLAICLPAFVPLPTALSAGAGGEIRPPFGLNWGMALPLVESSVREAGGRVVERSAKAVGRECWTVEGIAQEGLQRVLFTFSGGRLTGVELQFGKDDWDAQAYDEFMRRVRAGLDAEHGRGRLLVRQRAPEPRALKTLLGYAWSGSTQSVSLIYFSAQDQSNFFRLVSLHYLARPERTYSQAVSRL